MYRAVIAALDIGLYTLPCVFIIKIYGGARFAPARSARVGKAGCSVMPSLLRELPGLATGNLSQGNVRGWRLYLRRHNTPQVANIAILAHLRTVVKRLFPFF